MISRSFKNADIEYSVQFIFYIDFGVQSRCEDEKADASSGPSWFRGHRWVKNSNNNGFVHMIFIMEISEAKVQYNTFSVFYQTNMFWVFSICLILELQLLELSFHV
jgi:hypothetical protein